MFETKMKTANAADDVEVAFAAVADDVVEQVFEAADDQLEEVLERPGLSRLMRREASGKTTQLISSTSRAMMT